jgi:hypothetical protein
MSRQVELVVYATNHHRYVDVFVGNTCFSNISKPQNEEQDAVNFNIQPNRDFHLIRDLKSMNDLSSATSVGHNEILMLGNTSILFINDTDGLSAKLNGLQIDFLVVGKQGIHWLKDEAASFNFNNVVLDSSLPSREITDITAKLPQMCRYILSIGMVPFVLRI